MINIRNVGHTAIIMAPKRQSRRRLVRGNAQGTSPSPERDQIDQPNIEGDLATDASPADVHPQGERLSPSATNVQAELLDPADRLPSSHESPQSSGQITSIVGHSSSSHLEATDRPVRPPAQRLATLTNPRGGSSIQNSTDARPAGLKFKPKSVQRRSKEEREAAEEAEAERQQARLAETVLPKTAERGSSSIRGRGRGLGANDRYNAATTSGHLGAGTRPVENAQLKRGRGRGRGGVGGGGGGGRGRGGGNNGESTVTSEHGLEPHGAAGGRASKGTTNTRRKKDSGIKTETDKDGNTIMGSTASKKKVKKEPGLSYGISSSESEGGGRRGKRINIEHINLISSDEDEGDEMERKGRERAKTPKLRNARPVRFHRDEHLERTVGVNTDPTTLTSAELRRRAQEKRDAQGSMFLDLDEGTLAPTAPPKGRGKTKDVEFIKDERKWQGVYQDDEDVEGLTRIKEEPKDDDMMILDGSPLDPASQLTGAVPSPNMEIESEPEDVEVKDAPNLSIDEAADNLPSSQTLQGDARPPSPQTELPPQRQRRRDRPRKPIIQTDEDYQEWERFREDQEWMQEILTEAGGVMKSDPDTKALDDDGDINMDNFNVGSSTRNGELYLFQFPPSLPLLVDARAKKEESIKTEKKEEGTAIPPPIQAPPPTAIPTPSTSSAKPPPKSKAKPKSKSKAKPIDEPLPEEHLPPPPPPRPQTYTPLSAPLPAGHIGTLRLHRSNRVTANWGTLQFEIGRSSERQLAQEIVACGWSKTVVKKEAFEAGDGMRIKGEYDDDEGHAMERERGDWRDEVRCGEKVWCLGNVCGGLVGSPDLGEMFGV